MRAPALAALLLFQGCAEVATTEKLGSTVTGTGGAAGAGSSGAAGAGGGGIAGASVGPPDARASDDAPRGGDDASLSDRAIPVDAKPPSHRDGSIPTPPPGEPPCAHDSNAGNGKTCPYETVVACRPVIDAGSPQVCYCFAPPLDGKWHCEDAHDGGFGMR